MKENVLISGISGFVGGNLSDYLHELKAYKIVGLVRGNTNSNNIYTTIQVKNFFERNQNSYDTYIHLAGKAHDTNYQTNKDEFIVVNTELTKQIYDHFLDDPNAKTFIFISSVAAVTNSSAVPLNENCQPSPNSFYGLSKYLAEQYILENMPSNNKKVYILRPPMIHGPGNKGNLNLLYNLILKGIPWPLGAFNNSRTFLSIGNLCFVIKELLIKKIESGIYNVSDDESISTSELVEMIAVTNGISPRIWKIPKPLIYIIAKIGNILPLPLNSARLEKLTENFLVSNEKIKMVLDIKKMPFTANEGMIKTIKSHIPR